MPAEGVSRVSLWGWGGHTPPPRPLHPPPFCYYQTLALIHQRSKNILIAFLSQVGGNVFQGFCDTFFFKLCLFKKHLHRHGA